MRVEQQVCQSPLAHFRQGRGGAPQGCDVALLDPLAERSDALDGVRASAPAIETTELVLVQTAARVTPVV